MKTELPQYNLWYDGIVEVTPDKLENLILKGVNLDKICVTEINDAIEYLNNYSGYTFTTKNECGELDLEWKIPEEYHNMDMVEFFGELLSGISTINTDYEKRVERFMYEIEQFEKRGLFDLLKVIKFIIDTFRKQKVVWGVGRGSSCASYILYLMGLHCVDPIKYDIPADEFFK